MRFWTNGVLRVLSIAVLLAVVAGLAAWRMDTASGQQTDVRVVVPSSWPVDGGEFDVDIEIVGLTDELVTYEWELIFNPTVIQFVPPPLPPGPIAMDGGFVGSTGRAVACLLIFDAAIDPGRVRFGCGTAGQMPPGPTGSGTLSTVRFSPVAQGSTTLAFGKVEVASQDEELDIIDIPAFVTGGCVVIVPPGGTSPGCPSPTPRPPAPTPTEAPPGFTPVPPTPTPGGPVPTPTPSGPVPTPTPLPPGLEAVPLVGGCNPVTSTYPDDTPIQTVAGRVGPAGNLVSLWMFDMGIWRAFSPQYPQVSDLTEADLLDVVFACVAGPGDFVRPII